MTAASAGKRDEWLAAFSVDALVEVVRDTKCDEVIILTEPHVVREFLHVDWTSRARRKLDVPTLHLLEHLTFEEQAEM